MEVLISVSAEDIARGEREECETCPIALAIRRVVPGTNVEVHYAWVGFGDRYTWRTTPENGDRMLVPQRVPLPWKAREFVDRFDAGEPVEPFEFHLDVPEDESIHSQTSGAVGSASTGDASDVGDVKGGVS